MARLFTVDMIVIDRLEPWSCSDPECRYIIGNIRSDAYLMLGDVPTSKWTGRCPACGKVLRWSRANWMMTRSIDEWVKDESSG